jgi:hypothetical protein
MFPGRQCADQISIGTKLYEHIVDAAFRKITTDPRFRLLEAVDG